MDATGKIKIMMAEDHTSARQAYVAMLGEEDNFMVTGHAENGYMLLKLLEKDEPHIVLTDLDMPVMNGNKLIAVLKAKYPKIKPIVLSMYDEAEYISQLVLNGACGYVPKTCSFEALVHTINKVQAEGYYFDHAVSRIIMGSFGAIAGAGKDLGLSPREIDVLKLICEEKENKVIAQLLNLSIHTVASYRQNILRKTEAAGPIGLYKYALRNGIVKII